MTDDVLCNGRYVWPPECLSRAFGLDVTTYVCVCIFGVKGETRKVSIITRRMVYSYGLHMYVRTFILWWSVIYCVEYVAAHHMDLVTASVSGLLKLASCYSV